MSTEDTARDPHHALNTPGGEPDLTEWPEADPVEGPKHDGCHR